MELVLIISTLGGSVRKRITYANVTATLALVFAMGGSAVAASHYLINSTKQINPKVLKKLRGASGAAGAPGKEGAPGLKGEKGEKGEHGERGETGPSHVYSAFGAGTATVNVPAGSYVVTGSGQFFNGGTKPGGGECELEATGLAETNWATVPNTGEEEPRAPEVYGAATVTNNATVQLKAAGSIKERCATSFESQAPVGVSTTEVTATLVGAIN